MDPQFDSIDAMVDALELPGVVADSPESGQDDPDSSGVERDPAQAPIGDDATTESDGEEATPEELEADLARRLEQIEARETRLNELESERNSAEEAAKLARDAKQLAAQQQQEAQFLREFTTKLEEEAPELNKLFVPYVRTLHQRVQAAEGKHGEQEQAIEAWVYAAHRVLDDQDAFEQIKALAMGMSGVPRGEMVAYADSVLREQLERTRTQTEQQQRIAQLERENAELKSGRSLDADAVDSAPSGGHRTKPREDWNIDDFVEFAVAGMPGVS